MGTLWRILWIPLFLSTVAMRGSSRELEAAEIEIAQVRAAWEARKSRTERLHLQTSSTIVSTIPGPGMAGKDPVQFTATDEIWIDGDLLSVETLHPDHQVNWKPSRRRHVFNSDGIQELSSPPGSAPEFNSNSFGEVTGDRLSTDAGLIAGYYPLMLAYRFAENHPLSFPLTNAHIDSETQQVNGIDCVVLKADRPGQPLGSIQVCVDQAREFVPVRVMSVYDERPTYQIDAEYNPNPDTGYELSGWTYTVLNGKGQLHSTEKVTVNLFDLPDAIAPETFLIKFPPGCTVVVLDGSPARTVVDAQGKIPGFNGASSDGSMNTRKSNSVLPVLVAVIGAVFIAVFWCKRWNRKKGGQ